MQQATLPNTDLSVSRLCLGGNVFGWTADEANSFRVLDAYVEAGGNFIDTADMYSVWGDGHVGGESETVIGRWMKARGNRKDLIIATKVAKLPARAGLAPANIAAACDDSLRRLQTDYIDLYYAHEDDETVPMAQTLAAFGRLVEGGKVRYIAASNFDAPRLRQSLRVSAQERLPRYVALQPQYSLLSRGTFEGELEALCQDAELSVFPYWALASGYLTGKYRLGPVDSPRAEGIMRYADLPQSERVLDALQSVAASHNTSMASVALAWCLIHPSVPSVIASARNTEQLADFVDAGALVLADDERDMLNDTGAL